jgi:putative nucleotidyltransferase with HDIG domain
MLPLFALLYVFARERDQRLASMIELNEVYRGTARALGDVVEHDDAYTGMHTRGVLNLAIAVAEELELDPIARRNTELGALLHDVGKVVIPNEIINKAGPLDEDEWTLIKTHTIEGQRILDEVGGLMSTVGRVVRAAHERWDGDGYPDGLSGEDIPLESRVIFCCDAMNAMTTTRSYRAARPPREALAELQRNAGTQFDPDVVAALTTVVERDLARSLERAAEPVAS